MNSRQRLDETINKLRAVLAEAESTALASPGQPFRAWDIYTETIATINGLTARLRIEIDKKRID